MARAEAPSLRDYVAQRTGAIFLAARRFRPLHRPRARHEPRRRARGSGRPLGASCDREPTHRRAGADRTRWRCAAHRHSAARCRTRSSRRFDRSGRDRCRGGRRAMRQPRAALELPVRVACAPSIVPANTASPARLRTEWVLLTSGTTGVPKMVMHILAGLTAAIRSQSPADGAAVWGTFYDIRRYGGLQIFLRAVLGGASLVLVKRRRAGRRSSRAARRTWRHPSFRHPVALAPRADESGDPQHCAALRPAVGRDCRPGDPRQSARGVSAGRDRPRLRLDRGRRRLRCQ